MVGKLALGIAKFTAKQVIKAAAPDLILAGACVAEAGIEAGAKAIGNLSKAGIAASISVYDDLKKKYVNSSNVKTVKKMLDVEDDVFIDEAVIYWNLLDDINAIDFEYKKKQLM